MPSVGLIADLAPAGPLLSGATPRKLASEAPDGNVEGGAASAKWHPLVRHRYNLEMRSGHRFASTAFALLLVAGCARGAANGDVSAAGSPNENVSYTVDGHPVRLVGGVAVSEAAPGSASRVVTRYVGNTLLHDLNGDGREDVAGLITQDHGGSGTFYYVVAALQTDSGYVGSHALLLGDRIIPRALTPGPRRSIVVRYADRAPGEPMATPPTRERTLQLLLNERTLQFGEVAQGFEGEANPARMTLAMKTWIWVRAQYGDGLELVPLRPGTFMLTLSPDGAFSAATDCNQVTGSYSVGPGEISFGEAMVSTKMYCEGSQEAAFTSLLRETHRYLFTSRGELVLQLRFDSGVVVFR
jgi:heat shock protein HslJ